MQSDTTGTAELIKRLRGLADCDARAGEPLGKCMREAADALEAAERRRVRLEKAARPDCVDCSGTGEFGKHCICLCVNHEFYKTQTEALEAAERVIRELDRELMTLGHGGRPVVVEEWLARHATQRQGGDDD